MKKPVNFYHSPLIVALDTADLSEALRLVNLLRNEVKIFKVGLTAFMAGGKELVAAIKSLGAEVFLDLKLFDIPHQIAQTCEQIIEMGVKMFTLHTLGGIDMLSEAVRITRGKTGVGNSPLVFGVTILTSQNEETFRALGFKKNISEQILSLSELARKAGLDGVVASAWEVEQIKKNYGKEFLTVVPGVRPLGRARDDQRRTMTPAEAVRRGADYIVVGRPITQAANPRKVVAEILREVRSIRR